MRSGRQDVEEQRRLVLGLDLRDVAQWRASAQLDHREQHLRRIRSATLAREDDRVLRPAISRRFARGGVMQRAEVLVEHVTVPFGTALGELETSVVLALGGVDDPIAAARLSKAVRIPLHREPEARAPRGAGDPYGAQLTGGEVLLRRGPEVHLHRPAAHLVVHDHHAAGACRGSLDLPAERGRHPARQQRPGDPVSAAIALVVDADLGYAAEELAPVQGREKLSDRLAPRPESRPLEIAKPKLDMRARDDLRQRPKRAVGLTETR